MRDFLSRRHRTPVHPVYRAARTKTAAFTLIELLVVVAIMGVLMALLFPALNAARASGRSVACRSRLRQWVASVHQYADDHQGRLPSSQTSAHPINGLRSTAWYDYGISQGFPEQMLRCPSSGPSNLRLLPDRSILPIRDTGDWPPKNFGAYRPGYGANGFWLERNDQWSDPYRGLRLAQVPDPSRIALFADGDSSPFPQGEPSNSFRYRHGPAGDRIAVGFFDGAVTEWGIEECRPDGDRLLVGAPMRQPPLWKIPLTGF